MKWYLKYIPGLLISCLFFKQNIIGQNIINQNKIISQEYWFDNDFAGRVISSVTPVNQYHLLSNISANSLGTGLHIFNIRFKDLNGQFSEISSTFFLKTSALVQTNPKLIAYEYWFDDDFSSKVYTSISATKQYHLLNGFSASGLSDGLHRFCIRFKDDSGQYSAVQSTLFLKEGLVTTINPKLMQYEYWFDDDFSTKVNTGISATKQYHLLNGFSASGLSDGLHIFRIRFMDDQHQWSSVFSSFFIKNEAIPDIQNKIIAYRWWLDDSVQAAHVVNLPVSVNHVHVLQPLDLTQYWSGNYVLHVQFLDSLSQWSSVFSNNIFKTTFPIADFTANPSEICLGDSISFSNMSIDADIYTWDFGDSMASNDSLPLPHFYTNAGIYTISLTVADTISGLDSSFTQTIQVSDLPIKQISVNGSLTLCPGDSVILNADNNATYLWSTGDTSQSIVVDQAGSYSVWITSSVAPFCSVFSDTVIVSILPTYNLNDSTSICSGDSIQLPDGSFTSSSGIFVSNLSTWQGCDSIISTTVDEILVDTSVQFLNDSLWATISGANYQWLNCDNGYAPITGATNQGFKPLVNGHFAVQITQNGCTDTSGCRQVVVIGIKDTPKDIAWKLYPNPTSGILTISTTNKQELVKVIIRSITGQQVAEEIYDGISIIETEIPGAHGIYLIQIDTDNQPPAYFMISKN